MHGADGFVDLGPRYSRTLIFLLEECETMARRLSVVYDGALMDKSRLEIKPKIWLDYRRAIFLEEHSVLAVADLHLGYAWAHRFHGQMLPLGGGDRLLERLTELCGYYKPRQFAFLGDIVHQAVPVAEV